MVQRSEVVNQAEDVVNDDELVMLIRRRVIQVIWDEPRGTDGTFLWYGLAKGAPLNFLAGTLPFPIATDHFRFWIEQNPAFNWQILDYAGFEQGFHESQDLFNDVIGTDEPDLSAFRDAGGKVLTWHGWNDQLIFPEGAIDYYERVIDTFHSTEQVQRFARLFMAPGVFHCGGGTGPQVFDSFGALVRWVENGEALDRIVASRVENGVIVRTRPLCVIRTSPATTARGSELCRELRAQGELRAVEPAEQPVARVFEVRGPIVSRPPDLEQSRYAELGTRLGPDRAP